MCRSDRIMLAHGGITGMSKCKACGYVGLPVVERRILGEKPRKVVIAKAKTFRDGSKKKIGKAKKVKRKTVTKKVNKGKVKAKKRSKRKSVKKKRPAKKKR